MRERVIARGAPSETLNHFCCSGAILKVLSEAHAFSHARRHAYLLFPYPLVSSVFHFEVCFQDASVEVRAAFVLIAAGRVFPILPPGRVAFTGFEDDALAEIGLSWAVEPLPSTFLLLRRARRSLRARPLHL